VVHTPTSKSQKASWCTRLKATKSNSLDLVGNANIVKLGQGRMEQGTLINGCALCVNFRGRPAQNLPKRSCILKITYVI
jgi:hypothetical protein